MGDRRCSLQRTTSAPLPPAHCPLLYEKHAECGAGIERPSSCANLQRASLYFSGIRLKRSRASSTLQLSTLRSPLSSQLGGKVARVYVLSHGESDDFHITAGGALNERWFLVLDRVIQIAGELGVRLILPFVNTVWYTSPPAEMDM